MKKEYYIRMKKTKKNRINEGIGVSEKKKRKKDNQEEKRKK